MNVYLLGFMASGKSTLGPVLAERAGRPFHDLDSAVQAEAGASVAEIFAREGEEGFRDREARALQAAAARGDLVVATGGGIVERAANCALLAQGHAVYLRWSWAALRRRLLAADAGERPLRSEGLAALQRRWRRRAPLYAELARQILDMREAPPGNPRPALEKLADSILAALPAEEA
jgi:shikimate kinase